MGAIDARDAFPPPERLSRATIMPARKPEEALFAEIREIVHSARPLLMQIEEFRGHHLQLAEEQLSAEDLAERQANRRDCRKLDEPDAWYPIKWPAWSDSLKSLKTRIATVLNSGHLHGRPTRLRTATDRQGNISLDEQSLFILEMDKILHQITDVLRDYPLVKKISHQVPRSPGNSLQPSRNYRSGVRVNVI